MQSLEELSLLVQSTTANAITSQTTMRKERSPLIERIVDYVQHHYTEELSLKILAARFNVNATLIRLRAAPASVPNRDCTIS